MTVPEKDIVMPPQVINRHYNFPSPTWFLRYYNRYVPVYNRSLERRVRAKPVLGRCRLEFRKIVFVRIDAVEVHYRLTGNTVQTRTDHQQEERFAANTLLPLERGFHVVSVLISRRLPMPGVLLSTTVRDTGKRCVRGGYKPQQRTGIAGLLDKTGDGRAAQLVHMNTRRANVNALS